MRSVDSAKVRRNNHFNLIRFLAASLVIFSHCFPLLHGSDDLEPFFRTTGITGGTWAVYLFFATSGYLITQSFRQSASIKDFVIKRLLRIYPPLIVAVCGCVILGACLTTIPLPHYFLSRDTAAFMVKNTILIYPSLHYTLPGVFNNNPYPDIVNGSLWTLPWELVMYTIVIVFGIATLLRRQIALNLLFITSSVLATLLQPNKDYAVLALFFMSGILVQINQDHIRFQLLTFLGCIVATVILLIYVPNAAYLIPMPVTYALLYLVFTRNPFLERFNNIGDYSYGLYIYAFPVQQTLMNFRITQSIPSFFIITFLITRALAFLSWHIVEKKALRLKVKVLKHTPAE